MTTKRKQILKAVAAAGSATMDDLMLATGLERKNLHDNLKATMKEFLIERIRDDVTGLPAYKTTAKGRMWLASKEDSSVTTQAGSGDITPATLDGSTSHAIETQGRAKVVIEPPTPDESPAAVRSDANEVNASAAITEFCQWLGRRNITAKRPPRNLRECKDILSLMLLEVSTFLEQELTIKQLREMLANEESKVAVDTKAPARTQHTSFAVMPDYPDMTIHQSIETARKEAEETCGSDGAVHVVAIVDTAEMAIKWASRP